MNQLEATGVIGPFERSKARKVNIPNDYVLEIFFQSLKLGKTQPSIPRTVEGEPVNVETIQANALSAVTVLPIKLDSKLNKKAFWDWLFK